jgi:hypothetical protein
MSRRIPQDAAEDSRIPTASQTVEYADFLDLRRERQVVDFIE